jgi:hypothetical protein
MIDDMPELGRQPSPFGLSFPINFDRHLDEAGGAL